MSWRLGTISNDRHTIERLWGAALRPPGRRPRWRSGRPIGFALAVAVLFGGLAGAASANSDISTALEYVAAPGQGISLPGMGVTNSGPDPAAGVTLEGKVPDTDNEGHPVDWQIFTNKATISAPFGGFIELGTLTGPPFGVDSCTFTSATDYRCDIGPLAVGETRTVVFNPTWEVANTATGYVQWHGFSYTATLVGGTDPDPTNNDNEFNFVNNGFYYASSTGPGIGASDLQVVEQSPPTSGAYAPGATVTLKITSTVPMNSVGGSVSVVVPDPNSVSCSGDGICLTGGSQAMTGPPNRVLVAMAGPPMPGGGWPQPPLVGPYVFTALLSAKLPATAPSGCAPGKTVPYTFDTTQQPVAGGSALVSTSIIKLPLTVQIQCPATPRVPPPPPTTPPPPAPPVGPPPAPPAIPVTDLAITKTASKSPTVGHHLRYRLTVTNHGPATALGAVVTDKLSDRLRFVSAKTKQGDCRVDGKDDKSDGEKTRKPRKGGTVRCTLDPLAVGAKATITITVTPRKAGSVTNTARVSSTTPDTNPKNNTDSVRRKVTRSARLSVRKTVDHRTVTAGDLVHFRITVRNSRAATARDVRVCDRPPSGLTFVETPHAKQRKGQACWTVKRLARGKHRSFRVTARATGTSRARTITNKVVVRADNAKTRRAHARVHVRPTAVRPGGVTG